MYQSDTCQQLAMEAKRSLHAQPLSLERRIRTVNDGLATAAAIVVFWPAALLVGGNGQTAAELAQLKGQSIASSKRRLRRNVPSSFWAKRSPKLPR